MAPALLVEKPAQIAPSAKANADVVLENYEGNYKFAPISEAEVSRAMIKRSVSLFFKMHNGCWNGLLSQVLQYNVRQMHLGRRYRRSG